KEDERRGKAALVFMEMVLGDPRRIEAEPFGVDDLRGRQPVPLGGVRLIEQTREETQAFRQHRYRHLPAIMHQRDRVRDLLDRPSIALDGLDESLSVANRGRRWESAAGASRQSGYRSPARGPADPRGAVRRLLLARECQFRSRVPNSPPAKGAHRRRISLLRLRPEAC